MQYAQAGGRSVGTAPPAHEAHVHTNLRADVSPVAVWQHQLQRSTTHAAVLELLLGLGRRVRACWPALTSCRRWPLVLPPPLLLLLQVLILLVLQCASPCTA